MKHNVKLTVLVFVVLSLITPAQPVLYVVIPIGEIETERCSYVLNVITKIMLI